MHVFLDAHVPMVKIFEAGERVTSFVLRYTAHEHILPDACAEIINASLGGSASSISPLTAIFLRTLPELAQPTQVNALLNKHATAVAPFIHQITLCAVLGNYNDNIAAPYTFEVRKNIISDFDIKECTNMLKNLQSDQMIFFYALREYLGYFLKFIPSVEALLEAQVAFGKQRARVSDALRAARNANITSFSDFLGTVNDIFKKNYKRLPKRKSIPRGRGDRSNALCVITNRTVKKRGLKRTAGNAFDTEFFGETIKKIKTDGLSVLDSIVNDEVQGAAEAARYESFTDSAAKASAAYQIDAGDDTIRILSDVVFAADSVLGMVRVPLPREFSRMQLEAIARRFSVPLTDSKIMRATRAHVCLGCGSLKNFVGTRLERTGKQTTSRAAGFRKLALNVDDPCGSKMVCFQEPGCHNFDVEEHEIITPNGDSCVLVNRKWAITISPCCGLLVHANSIQANKDSPHGFDCPGCAKQLKVQFAPAEPDARKCAYCSKHISAKHAGNVALLFDEDGALFKFGFCKSHWRPWCRTSDGYCTLRFVSLNMQNRRGGGLVLPS